jgi:vacuolar protein sorting-associated protein 45
MKALVLDPMTTKIVSMVYSQTQILEQSVYLVELLGNAHEPMLHLKAALFIQPTENNLSLLLNELRTPKYAEYHIFFSNVVPADLLVKLAREDVNEIIKQVNEYYADFVPVNEDFFHLGAINSTSLASSIRSLKTDQIFSRNLNGLLSVLLATKKKPVQIRFQNQSDICQRLANECASRIEADGIFLFNTPGPILLILDRFHLPI